MTEQSQALVPQDTPYGAGTLMAKSPAVFVQRASAIATELAAVIEKKKLYKTIGNKNHVYVEGWTTLCAMLGVTPREVSNEDQGNGVYVAVVELVNIDGRVVGRASGECGNEDELDHYGNPTWSARAAYARRSMAATRATSKACRLSFSWIMTLAGYSPTPAEEMEPAEGQTAPRAQEQPRQTGPWDGSKVLGFGKFKGKKWSELPEDYLVWMLEKMQPPAKDDAKREIDRRAKKEAAPAPKANAPQGEEPPDDSQLPMYDAEPVEEPEFR